MKNLHLAVQLFLQLAVLLFCRAVGAVAARFGQPQVVAERAAGVLLGPSLFGLLWPDAQHWLFPWDKAQKLRDTQSYLFPLSQLGLAPYMFVVGIAFRMDIVQRRLKSSIAVSVAGMVTPFALGAGLAWVLYYHKDLFPKRTSLFEAILFLGASMCITAFPMTAALDSLVRADSRWEFNVSVGGEAAVPETPATSPVIPRSDVKAASAGCLMQARFPPPNRGRSPSPQCPKRTR